LAKDEIKVDNIKVANGKVYKAGDGGLKIVQFINYIDRTFVVNAMPKGP